MRYSGDDYMAAMQSAADGRHDLEAGLAAGRHPPVSPGSFALRAVTSLNLINIFAAVLCQMEFISLKRAIVNLPQSETQRLVDRLHNLYGGGLVVPLPYLRAIDASPLVLIGATRDEADANTASTSLAKQVHTATW